MEEFRVMQPAPVLVPYIKNYWFLKTVGRHGASERTVPTGMMSLIFHRGNRLLSLREGEFHPRAFLCGHERMFADLRYDGQVDMIAVVFRPAGARAFFQIPLNETAGLRLSGGDLEDREFSLLENDVANAENEMQSLLLIERFLSKRLMHPARYNIRRIDAAISLIESGRTDIASIAAAACLGPKQFSRVFAGYVGICPKEFLGTVRFQRVLHTLETQPHLSLTAVAQECGYFDQSHMIREFKTFAGYTPGQYLALCQPHSDYFGR